ncbi:MAG: hypothetical protein ABI852_22295 [Gemmatimonadaceae bacterium]
MKLSDIMSNAGLSGYAEVALVLFLFAFTIIVVRTFLPSRKLELEATAMLPLQDAPRAAIPAPVRRSEAKRRGY